MTDRKFSDLLAAFDREWKRYANTPEYRQKMALAQEIAIIDAESFEVPG